MRRLHSLSLLATGAALGVAFVLSCSGGPGAADAAACDCPAAEAPIVASRLQLVTNLRTIPPGTQNGNSVNCPPGGILLTGGCVLETPGVAPDLVLNQSGMVGATGDSWRCEWQNNSVATTYDIKVEVKCLMPAQ